MKKPIIIFIGFVSLTMVMNLTLFAIMILTNHWITSQVITIVSTTVVSIIGGIGLWYLYKKYLVVKRSLNKLKSDTRTYSDILIEMVRTIDNSVGMEMELKVERTQSHPDLNHILNLSCLINVANTKITALQLKLDALQNKKLS